MSRDVFSKDTFPLGATSDLRDNSGRPTEVVDVGFEEEPILIARGMSRQTAAANSYTERSI